MQNLSAISVKMLWLSIENFDETTQGPYRTRSALWLMRFAIAPRVPRCPMGPFGLIDEPE